MQNDEFSVYSQYSEHIHVALAVLKKISKTPHMDKLAVSLLAPHNAVHKAFVQTQCVITCNIVNMHLFYVGISIILCLCCPDGFSLCCSRLYQVIVYSLIPPFISFVLESVLFNDTVMK